MEKTDILTRLQSYADRLNNDVAIAYNRGADFGQERFGAWMRSIERFLNVHLPGAYGHLERTLGASGSGVILNEPAFSRFIRTKGNPCLAFIDSLMIEIRDGEFELSEPTSPAPTGAESGKLACDSVFIVHGHDEAAKVSAARFVEQLGFQAIILHEQANKGMTIIEKFEEYSDVGFALVLYTADDLGNSREDVESGQLNSRARQNVVFEHGYLIAKLGRSRVVPLVNGSVELPGDLSGVVYVGDANWEIDIAKEMKSVGYKIDLNTLVES